MPNTTSKLITLSLQSTTPTEGLRSTPFQVGQRSCVLHVPEAGYTLASVTSSSKPVFTLTSSNEHTTAVFVDGSPVPFGVRVYTYVDNTERVYAFTRSSDGTFSKSSLDDYFLHVKSAQSSSKSSAPLQTASDLSRSTKVTVDLATVRSSSDVSRLAEHQHESYSLSLCKLSPGKVVDRVVYGSLTVWSASASNQYAVMVRHAKRDDAVLVAVYSSDTDGNDSFKFLVVSPSTSKVTEISQSEFNAAFSSTSLSASQQAQSMKTSATATTAATSAAQSSSSSKHESVFLLAVSN